MKKFNRLSVFFILLISSLMNAQPPCPDCGEGGYGPGRQKAPIDMYVYVLAIAAILMIVYFAKKYKTQKV